MLVMVFRKDPLKELHLWHSVCINHVDDALIRSDNGVNNLVAVNHHEILAACAAKKSLG